MAIAKLVMASLYTVQSGTVPDVDTNQQVQWCQKSSKTTLFSFDYNNQKSVTDVHAVSQKVRFTNCTFSARISWNIPPHTEECLEVKAVAKAVAQKSSSNGARPYALQYKTYTGKCKSSQLSAVGSEIVPDVDVNREVQWCQTSSKTTLLEVGYNNQASATEVQTPSQKVRFTNCTFSARMSLNIPPHTEECLEVKAVAQKSSSNGAKPYALQYQTHTGKCKSANVASVVI